MTHRQRLALVLIVCGTLIVLAAVVGLIALMEYSFEDARNMRQNLVKLLEKPGVTSANMPPWTRPDTTLLYVVAAGGLVTAALGAWTGLSSLKTGEDVVPRKAPVDRDWSEPAVA